MDEGPSWSILRTPSCPCLSQASLFWYRLYLTFSGSLPRAEKASLLSPLFASQGLWMTPGPCQVPRELGKSRQMRGVWWAWGPRAPITSSQLHDNFPPGPPGQPLSPNCFIILIECSKIDFFFPKENNSYIFGQFFFFLCDTCSLQNSGNPPKYDNNV